MINANLLTFFIKYKDSFKYKDFIIDMFTESDFEKLEVSIDEMKNMIMNDNNLDNLYLGKIFDYENTIYYLKEKKDNDFIIEKLPFNIKKPLLSIKDEFILKKGMIDNYNGVDVKTTIGRFFSNQLLLVIPFDKKINYINEKIKIDKISSEVVTLIINKEIDLSQVKTYINSIYFINGLSEFFIGGLTKKSITPSKILKEKREELFKKYKDQLDDPIIMIKIENELKKIDIDYLKDDPSMGYFGDSAKAFNIQRKRMFSSIGMLEGFGESDNNKFNFSTSNLDDGWKKEDLPILFNDIRMGIYNRAKDTAKGGAETKMLGRIFQEAKIIEDDCKSKNGIKKYLSNDIIEKFYYRHIIVDNKLVLLTEKNASLYLNKNVIIRSPMYCKTVGGFCNKCMDYRFKEIGLNKLNTIPINITSTIMYISMKAMHGIKTDFYTLDSFNKFLL